MGEKDRSPAAARRGRGEGQIEALNIEVEQRIDAPPSTVFAFLVEPAKFVEWMGIDARLDARPGGTFRLNVDGEHFARGEFREVEAPHRVVFTWGWEGDSDLAPGSTTVEITLTPAGGGTLLRLRHTGFANPAQRDSHREGWIMYAGKLASRVRGEPSP